MTMALGQREREMKLDGHSETRRVFPVTMKTRFHPVVGGLGEVFKQITICSRSRTWEAVLGRERVAESLKSIPVVQVKEDNGKKHCWPRMVSIKSGYMWKSTP